MAPGGGRRTRRLVRRATLGSGPLKRRTDRVQLAARLVLLVAVVLAPIPAAVVVGTSTARLEAVATAQAAERRLVDAVLLDDARRSDDRIGVQPGSVVVPVVVPVRAGWQQPGELPHEATVYVPPGTRAGTPVQVWLGPDGEAVAPPLARGDIPGRAMSSGVLVLLIVPLGAWGLYAALVVALDAHRMHRWGEEWAAVEPRWGTRLT
jgi:hypothetical protein